MASQIKPEDKARILKGIVKKIGDKPYEKGYWGANPTRDFVLVEVFDDGGNFIEYRDVSFTNSVEDLDDDFIKVKPSKHLQLFGYNAGKFRLRYRFLRKLAGDEATVLTKTKPEEEGDIYLTDPNANNIYITENGIIYSGTEQQYIDNPSNAQQLFLKNYKYEIDAISPSRTEVRLRAQKIGDQYFRGMNYVTDFKLLQNTTANTVVDSSIEIIPNVPTPTNESTDIANSNDLQIVLTEGGFIFDKSMIGGSLTIPDAIQTGIEIVPNVRVGGNFVRNGDLEEEQPEAEGGNSHIPRSVTLGDQSLHSDAIVVKEWNDGFQYFTGAWEGEEHLGTAAIGYHAKFVRGEGKGGGICIKFTDQNDFLLSNDDWPSNNAHRLQRVTQTNCLPLANSNISPGDFVNITLDLKSTVAGKGVSVQIRYPTGYNIEGVPDAPPVGFYDPINPILPDEEVPTSPPEGFFGENSSGNASQIENQPPQYLNNIIANYPVGGIFSGQVGDTTADNGMGGVGVWVITSVQENVVITGGDVTNVYEWGPNLGNNYTQQGALSPEGDWIWDGIGAWGINPTVYNSFPVAPAGTVRVGERNNVVNESIHQYPGQGLPIFGRPVGRADNGLGSNFSTATIGNASSNSYFSHLKVVWFFKDDLIWQQAVNQSTDTPNIEDVQLYEFKDIFPATANYSVENPDGTTKSIYEDIFEGGYIQSVTRVKTDNDLGDEDLEIARGLFLIFYNNGDVDINSGLPTTFSNRYFFYQRGLSNYNIEHSILYKGNGGYEDDPGNVLFLENFNSEINSKVMSNGGDLEVSFYRGSSPFEVQENVTQTDGMTYIFLVSDTEFAEIFLPQSDLQDLPAADIIVDDSGDTVREIIGNFDVPGRAQTSGFTETAFGPVPFPNGIPSLLPGNFNYSRFETIHNRPGNPAAWMKSGIEFTGIVGAENILTGVDVTEKYPGVGQNRSGGLPLIFGVRNPAAENYDPNAHYDSGGAIFPELNPYRTGALSPLGQFIWNYEPGSNNMNSWEPTGVQEPVTYGTIAGNPRGIRVNQSDTWETGQASFLIPDNWLPNEPWGFVIIGVHRNMLSPSLQMLDEDISPDEAYGITWVDNVYGDFTKTGTQQSLPVYSDYSVMIEDVNEMGDIVSVDKTFNQVISDLSANDIDSNSSYNEENPAVFQNFKVSYLLNNPFDLRTYLKFGNRLFLTTNFKRDVSSNPYPYSIVYKLYEPLPNDIEELDEVIVVKEMADVKEEAVEIVDFVDTALPDTVLRSPDIMNAESPIQRRTTQYKNTNDILTSDNDISDSLKNEFLSQSLDSVEVNVDYSQYQNFVNFSSVEERIKNFKSKLELIESYTNSSASFNGISGSVKDANTWEIKIKDTKNKFDPFEKYMYFESSSYVSGSIGQFYDNAWPKISGTGRFGDNYVLAHTTSSTATTWFNNAINSASLYDTENFNKLSNLLPAHIRRDAGNETYLKFTDMIAHHFDNIWIYIKALGDVYDRRDKLNQGISKDLLFSVGQSLGWELSDGKDTIALSKFALGKEVTGSAYSSYSSVSERDVSREVWSRIINNMPYFLNHKGTVRSIKGLISAYGIPSTILRVKEYGGPDLEDSQAPQFEITRKFTKALDFRSTQHVKTTWTNDGSTGRKPDTVELRFRAASGSNLTLVEKVSSQTDFAIRLKDNNSEDNYGYVSFLLSGSDGYKEVSSSNLPVYDGDFYSVMLQRTSGSDNAIASQSFQLSVGKYDSGFNDIQFLSHVTMSTDIAASSSYNSAFASAGTNYIGGYADTDTIGKRFSGSIMEYRHWTETLNPLAFKNHIANPKSYNGNTLSSSYNNLVLRYSFDDNNDLSTDTNGIRDVSSNQTTTYSGSHVGFTGNFFRSVVDEQKSFIPSIGALRRVTNKIRIEDNPIKKGFNLSKNLRATVSAYDSAPTDSNKAAIFFAPTDAINNDIINSLANINFGNFIGDPRDREKLDYRGLKKASDNYWKKYNSPNDFWDYIRLIRYYDQSLFPQIRKMVPARAKADLGILVEPNILERPKVILSRKPTVESTYYSQSIDISSGRDKDVSVLMITSSYGAERVSISNYEAFTGRIPIFSYETGSNIVSSSGAYGTYTASNNEIGTRAINNTLWQRLNQPGDYVHATMSYGDFQFNEIFQPIITGSTVFGSKQKLNKFYNTEAAANKGLADSSSFFNADTNPQAEFHIGLFNSFYAGSKNTKLTTEDGGPVIEVVITSPSKLVVKETGDKNLDTGEGLVSKFKPKSKKKKFDPKEKEKSKKSKAPSAEKAIEKAQEEKGGFLTKEETTKTIDDYEKDAGIKKEDKNPVVTNTGKTIGTKSGDKGSDKGSNGGGKGGSGGNKGGGK